MSSEWLNLKINSQCWSDLVHSQHLTQMNTRSSLKHFLHSALGPRVLLVSLLADLCFSASTLHGPLCTGVTQPSGPAPPLFYMHTHSLGDSRVTGFLIFILRWRQTRSCPYIPDSHIQLLRCHVDLMSSKHLNINMSQTPLLISPSGSVTPCLSQFKGSIIPLAAQAKNLGAILDIFLLHSLCNLLANHVSSTSEIYLLSLLFFTCSLPTLWSSHHLLSPGLLWQPPDWSPHLCLVSHRQV